MLVYSLLNPYGAVHPLVLLAQVVGEALAGTAGGLFAWLRLPGRSVAVRAGTLAAGGLTLPAAVDLITHAAPRVVFGQMKTTPIGGIPFSLFHIAPNVAMFAALVPPLGAGFRRSRG